MLHSIWLDLWFHSHLQRFKYTGQGNLAVWNKMVPYHVTTMIIKDSFQE